MYRLSSLFCTNLYLTFALVETRIVAGTTTSCATVVVSIFMFGFIYLLLWQWGFYAKPWWSLPRGVGGLMLVMNLHILPWCSPSSECGMYKICIVNVYFLCCLFAFSTRWSRLRCVCYFFRITNLCLLLNCLRSFFLLMCLNSPKNSIYKMA